MGTEPLIYILDADQGVKIGVTSGPLEKRLGTIARTSGITPTVVRTFSAPSTVVALHVERVTHERLADCRTVGEWFHCHPLLAADLVQCELRKFER